eukprot:XP_001709421.1 Hypothetical protein GL50803_36969 [Giardia lamblia ATCC 50803]
MFLFHTLLKFSLGFVGIEGPDRRATLSTSEPSIVVFDSCALVSLCKKVYDSDTLEVALTVSKARTRDAVLLFLVNEVAPAPVGLVRRV